MDQSTSSSFISLQDITIQLDHQPVFEHSSWQIQTRQNWAIVGPTGSGKSILARAISHHLPLMQGQILYYFDPITHPQGRPYPERREILTLSPETHREFLKQYADYHQARWQSFEGEEAPTVFHLLSAAGIERHSPFEVTPFSVDEKLYQERREKVVNLFKLDYLLDRRIIHLSHGESRKVLIARLLMQSPRLLILDDPFTGLDPESRELLSLGIRDLLKQGSPQILMVASRADEIPPEINHFLVTQERRIAGQGQRETILRDSRFSALWAAPQTAVQSFQASNDFHAMIQTYAQNMDRSATACKQPVIQMENVSVRYNGTQVLKDINWTVQKGERWVLRGHNGAGKSTLLSLILADNPQAYANHIHLFGKQKGSGESIWEIKQNIGSVSPELHIYYHNDATCLNVVCSGFFDSVGLYRDCSQTQMNIAQSWINAFGLRHLAHTPFNTLSAGQQRLILLARALVKNPPLLILDEPCQGLDDDHRRYFVELLNQLCAQAPITLVYVTHYQDEIPAAITHQLCLQHGQISACGPISA